jgi:hypothetical protein
VGSRRRTAWCSSGSSSSGVWNRRTDWRDVARELGLEGADKLARNLFEAMNVWDEEHGLAATPALCGPPPSVPSTSVFISP